MELFGAIVLQPQGFSRIILNWAVHNKAALESSGCVRALFGGKETVHDSHRQHDFHHGRWFGDRTWSCGGAAQTREPGHHFRSPEIAFGSNDEGESRNGLGGAGPTRPKKHCIGSKKAHRPVSEA